MRLTGRQVSVVGAGRTDAGVHATGQVVHFDISWSQSLARLAAALNAQLSAAVVVRATRRVGSAFHARHGAVRRAYRYRIWRGPAAWPAVGRFAHVTPDPLVPAWMREAAAHFEGVHDFGAFGSPMTQRGTTLRRVDRCAVVEIGPEIVIEVVGNAFLRHQVRRMVGLLLAIGRGHCAPGTVGEALRGSRRVASFGLAPAQGLTLTGVWYPVKLIVGSQPVDGPGCG